MLVFLLCLLNTFSHNNPQTTEDESSNVNEKQQPIRICSYSVTLLLSILLGYLGVDQCYLGHYTYALFKFFTFGLYGILYLVDIFLIVFQVIQPNNGIYSFPDGIHQYNTTFF